MDNDHHLQTMIKLMLYEKLIVFLLNIFSFLIILLNKFQVTTQIFILLETMQQMWAPCLEEKKMLLCQTGKRIF